ncbi:hypothetical protein G6O67_008867 [Ophiocordyceps sinensis]|uniref:Myb-like domain-containing protein n=3 Tax=Ophiocordyceps sinensis TaxID=72228 RepID=A0A8H4LRK7_9HYPO|nr:transcription factor tfiiib component [Ophiocordyceps sinensis CO18]KAF4503817.1 hypothetical protein G6O67_008867 [Ophiocordyceps sinensis]
MSSMFKKKGFAFKPKTPTARPKPVNAPSVPAPKIVESQPSIDPPLDTASNDESSAPERPLQSLISPLSNSQSVGDNRRPSSPPPCESTQTTTPPDVPSQTGLQPRVPATDHVSLGTKTPSVETPVQADHSPQTAAADESATTPVPRPGTTVPPSSQSQSLTEALSEEHASRETVTETTFPSTPAVEVQNSSDTSAPAPSAVSPAPEPVKKPARRRNKRTAAIQEPRDGEEAAPPPPKRQRKKASRQVGDTAPRPRTRKRKDDSAKDGDGTTEQQKKSRKGRSPTPENAESQVVDLQQLKMADLTKDLRIGKKFSRHDELRDRERKARVRTKPSKEGDGVDDEATGSASPPSAEPDGQANVPTGDPISSAAPAAASGPQFRIVDGQIVLDQSSLFMDRHARAAAAQAGANMETVEENDFTRLITSSSFMTSSKLKGPNIWTPVETELFYRGLRMFGTEFEMISKMFPGKQRRHVKLKFNREERHNPKRIDAALIGEKTIKLDIDEYRAFTGAEFEPVETIEAEQRKIQEAYEQERQRIADELAETMRKKREDLFADDDGDPATGRKKKSDKRKGKQAVAYGLNGEPITQDA